MIEQSINNIVFKHINDEFGWGQYGDLKVLIRKSDMTINATKLCADGGKRFDNWLANKTAKALVALVDEKTAPGNPGAVSQVTAGPFETKGTYVHRDLIPHIACWVSPPFALKVSYIVNQYFVLEYMDTIKEQAKLLGEKDSSISRLEATLAEMNRKMDDANRKLDDANGKLDVANRKLDVSNENVVSVLDTLHDVSVLQVPQGRVPASMYDYLVVIRTPENSYRAITCQHRNLMSALRKHAINGNLPFQVYREGPHPNANEGWNAVRKQMERDGLIRCRGKEFQLVNCTEQRLVRMLQEAKKRRLQEYQIEKDVVSSDEEARVEARVEAGVAVPVALQEEKEEEKPVAVEVVTGDRTKLRLMTIPELKAICKENKWKGYSSRTRKEDLISFIQERLQN
jgi:KilA-N domain